MGAASESVQKKNRKKENGLDTEIVAANRPRGFFQSDERASTCRKLP